MKYIHSNETLNVPEGGKFIYVQSLCLGSHSEGEEGIAEYAWWAGEGTIDREARLVLTLHLL
jgi:hypothetical protein